jgi:predicted amidohydrolase YtcJ
MKSRNTNQILMKKIILFFVIITFFSCGETTNKASPELAADTIYHNGEIITMAGETQEYVGAIAVKDGKITKLGPKEEVLTLQGDSTVLINLNGKTMLPGFIDGHAHFSNFASQAIGAQLLPPPDAGAKDIPTLIQILKDWNTEENRALTGWIFGTGFDDSVLAEKRFPTKEDLDQVTTEFPIMIIHISGHFASLNSKGLAQLGISAATKDPKGGMIRRISNSQEPNGVLEELAAIPYYSKALTPQGEEALLKFMAGGQEMAVSYGYTTAQEGRAMEQHELLAAFAEKDFWKIDVVSYIDYAYPKYLESKWNSKDYKNNYRIGGMKLTLDGSPQGRTAWRTEPYLLAPHGAVDKYAGYPAIESDEDVSAIYEKAFKNDWQILTHANGDAAMDQMIRTMKPLAEKYGNDNRRNVLIHGQYVREDQLDSFKDLNVIASLFPLHTFYWGDWHKELIGDVLGNKISPVKTALNKGLNITIHTDAPVALPNLMRVVWTAVNRTSRSGAIIGAEERLTPYEALQAITIWSAYQHFEEDKKGSLEKGKLADLVILDKNPMKVAPDDIKDIIVLETIKEGTSIYKKQ